MFEDLRTLKYIISVLFLFKYGETKVLRVENCIYCVGKVNVHETVFFI